MASVKAEEAVNIYLDVENKRRRWYSYRSEDVLIVITCLVAKNYTVPEICVL